MQEDDVDGIAQVVPGLYATHGKMPTLSATIIQYISSIYCRVSKKGTAANKSSFNRLSSCISSHSAKELLCS